MTETLSFWKSPARAAVTVSVAFMLMLTGCSSEPGQVEAPTGQQTEQTGNRTSPPVPTATPGGTSPVATATPPEQVPNGPVATAAPAPSISGGTNLTTPGSSPGKPAPSGTSGNTPVPSQTPLDPSHGDFAGRHTTENNSMSWTMPDEWEWGLQWNGETIGGDSKGWTTGLVMSSPNKTDGKFTAIHYGETLYNGENGEPLTVCEPGAIYTILEREPLTKTMTAEEKAVAVKRVQGRDPGAALADHYLVTQLVQYSWGVEAQLFLSSTEELAGENCGAYDYASTPDRQVGLYVGVTDEDYRLSGAHQFKTPSEARTWLGTPDVQAAKDIIRSIDFNVGNK